MDTSKRIRSSFNVTASASFFDWSCAECLISLLLNHVTILTIFYIIKPFNSENDIHMVWYYFLDKIPCTGIRMFNTYHLRNLLKLNWTYDWHPKALTFNTNWGQTITDVKYESNQMKYYSETWTLSRILCRIFKSCRPETKLCTTDSLYSMAVTLAI